jgi:thiamine-monophosphate kinase
MAEQRPPATLGTTGEHAWLKRIPELLPVMGGVELGVGDDAAVVLAPDGRTVVCVDVLVEDRHFRRDWSEALDVGHRAAAANLADIASMGARPTALVVGLAAPKDLPIAWAEGLLTGMREEAALVGASVVGGDLAASEQLVIAVTALGDLDGRAPVTRAGAMPGDLVAIAGRLGWAQAGLAVLRRGFRSPRVLVAAHRRPEVPYGAGPLAAIAGATSMIDVSDGLLADAGHLADASGVHIDLDPAALIPDEPLRDVSSALGVDPLDWVLGGGDDHALLATFPAGATLPLEFRPIGVVSKGDPGVTFGGKGTGERPTGFDHFGS